MNAFNTIGLQSALSLIILTLLSIHYIVPRLGRLTLERALVPLLWVNTFRYLPLILFAPGQISETIPKSISQVIAFGDLLSGLLALASVLLLSYRIKGGIAMTWLFLVVGSIDSVNGVFTAISAKAYQFPMGFSWVVVTFFVLVIFVTEGLILHQFITNKNK